MQENHTCLNARLAYDIVQPGTAAFSPEWALVLGAGPLVGTLAPSSERTNTTSISPLSNLLGISGAGQMGSMKYCGYDDVCNKLEQFFEQLDNR